MHTTKINYHMYKLNQVITASKNQLLSYGEKLLTFFEKKAKIRLPSPHSAVMNSEFTAAWRGEELGYL